MRKFDKTYIGVIMGLILPIIGFFVSFLIKTRDTLVDFDSYLAMAVNHTNEQQDILIFCLIPNMFMFYLTNFRWRANKMTQGLVAITLLLGVALFIIVY